MNLGSKGLIMDHHHWVLYSLRTFRAVCNSMSGPCLGQELPPLLHAYLHTHTHIPKLNSTWQASPPANQPRQPTCTSRSRASAEGNMATRRGHPLSAPSAGRPLAAVRSTSSATPALAASAAAFMRFASTCVRRDERCRSSAMMTLKGALMVMPWQPATQELDRDRLCSDGDITMVAERSAQTENWGATSHSISFSLSHKIPLSPSRLLLLPRALVLIFLSPGRPHAPASHDPLDSQMRSLDICTSIHMLFACIAIHCAKRMQAPFSQRIQAQPCAPL